MKLSSTFIHNSFVESPIQSWCSDELLCRFLQCTVCLISQTCTLPYKTYSLSCKDIHFFMFTLSSRCFCRSKGGRTLNKVKEQTATNKKTNKCKCLWARCQNKIPIEFSSSHRNITNLISIILFSDSIFW